MSRDRSGESLILRLPNIFAAKGSASIAVVIIYCHHEGAIWGFKVEKLFAARFCNFVVITAFGEIVRLKNFSPGIFSNSLFRPFEMT